LGRVLSHSNSRSTILGYLHSQGHNTGTLRPHVDADQQRMGNTVTLENYRLPHQIIGDLVFSVGIVFICTQRFIGIE